MRFLWAAFVRSMIGTSVADRTAAPQPPARLMISLSLELLRRLQSRSACGSFDPSIPKASDLSAIGVAHPITVRSRMDYRTVRDKSLLCFGPNYPTFRSRALELLPISRSNFRRGAPNEFWPFSAPRSFPHFALCRRNYLNISLLAKWIIFERFVSDRTVWI